MGRRRRPFNTVTRQNKIVVAKQCAKPNVILRRMGIVKAAAPGPVRCAFRCPKFPTWPAKTANADYILCSLTKLHRQTTGNGFTSGEWRRACTQLVDRWGHRAITFDWQMMNVDDYFFFLLFFRRPSWLVVLIGTRCRGSCVVLFAHNLMTTVFFPSISRMVRMFDWCRLNWCICSNILFLRLEAAFFHSISLLWWFFGWTFDCIDYDEKNIDIFQ